MPKARLEFNLPEEQPEFDLAQNAGIYSCVLDDISNLFRKYRKYHDFKSKEVSKFFSQLDDEFIEILNDYPEINQY